MVQMELCSRPILAFLADPLRKHPRALSVRKGCLVAEGGSRGRVAFEDMVSGPSTKLGFFSSSLVIDLCGGTNVMLPAVRASEARTFARTVEKAWSEFNLEQLCKEKDSIRSLLEALEALETPVAYPAACLVDPLARDAADLTDRVLSKLNPAAVGEHAIQRVSPIVTFAKSPDKTR